MKLLIFFVLVIVSSALAASYELDFGNDDVIEFTVPGDGSADKTNQKVAGKPKDEDKVDEESKVEVKVDDKPHYEVKVDDEPKDEDVKSEDKSKDEGKVEDKPNGEVKIDEKTDDKSKRDGKINLEPKSMNMEWFASYGQYPYYIYGYRNDHVVYPEYTYPFKYFDVKSYDPDFFYNAHGFYPAY